MTFLKSHPAQPEQIDKLPHNRASGKAKRQKSTKAADTEAEISRYFISTKSADQDASIHRPQQKPELLHNKARTHDAPSALIDLPSAPFLGFGSCGTNSVSPVKRLDSPALRDLERKLARSPTRSTSYFTWSQSGAPGSRQSQKHRVLPLEASGLANRDTRSLTSQDHGASQAPTSPPAPAKALSKKHYLSGSLSSKHPTKNQSRSSKAHSAQPGVRPASQPAVSNQRQEAEEIRVDDTKADLYVGENVVPETQIRKSPDQPQPISKPLPEDSALTSDNPTQSKAVVPPESHNRRIYETTSPLGNTLETLLQELTTSNTTHAIQYSVQQPAPDTVRSSERLTDDHADQTNIIPSRGSSCRQHEQALSSRVPTSAPTQSDHAGMRPLGDHQHGFRIFAHPMSRADASCSQPPLTKSTSDLPRPVNTSTGDSRTAWTGYENMYERQQDLDSLSTFGDKGFALNHYQGDPKDCGALGPDEPYPENFAEHFLYHVDGEIDEIEDLGYMHDERTGYWSGDNTGNQYEVSYNHMDSHNIEENLYAERSQQCSPGHLTPGNEWEQQEHMSLDEPQSYPEQIRGTYRSYDALLEQGVPATSGAWHQDADYPSLPSGHIGWRTVANLGESPEDRALAKFWTPHKLY